MVFIGYLFSYEPVTITLHDKTSTNTPDKEFTDISLWIKGRPCTDETKKIGIEVVKELLLQNVDMI